jgi:SAM-dependent methyltransferase
MKTKLNIGCGKDIKKTEYGTKYTYDKDKWVYRALDNESEWIDLDCINLPGVDVVHDLEWPLPFKDNQFEEVYASHILEHINKFVQLMEELHRVCKPEAKIRIIVPYFASASAFQDPTHVRFFTLKTFNYFLPDNYNNFITDARFEITKKKLKLTRRNWIINIPFEFIINLIPGFYERFLCFIFPCSEVYYELRVVKDYYK